VPVLALPHAGKAVALSKHRLCTSPLKLPLDSARHAPGRRVDTAPHNAEMNKEYLSNPYVQLSPVGGQMEQGHPGTGRPLISLLPLVLLLAHFLASAFSGQRGLYALLFTGFQVKGMTLDLFDNVFLLYFALEAA
jgi:hypothetical protein